MNTAPIFLRRSLRGLLTIGDLLIAAAFGVFVIVTSAQSSPANQSSPRPAESKPAREKSPEAQHAAKPNTHHFDRVLIIVLENADYEVAVRDKNLAELATHGASFSNFHALFHPSYPNYLAMVAGTDFGTHRRARIFGDKQVNFPADAAHKTIADRLIEAGLDWKNYAEELPDVSCPFRIYSQHVASSKKGDYARKHVPFLSFQEVQQKWCDHVVPVDSGRSDNWFAQDAKKGLVAYSFFSPNMDDDGHDSSLRIAGEWLKDFLDKNFPEKVRQGTLVVVTFDESGGNSDNRIFTLFFGDMVKEAGEQDPKVLGRHYNHYNLLRTIEENFGLEPLTQNDREAELITDIWK
jgi:hypothetical protein